MVISPVSDASLLYVTTVVGTARMVNHVRGHTSRWPLNIDYNSIESDWRLPIWKDKLSEPLSMKTQPDSVALVSLCLGIELRVRD